MTKHLCYTCIHWQLNDIEDGDWGICAITKNECEWMDHCAQYKDRLKATVEEVKAKCKRMAEYYNK